MLHEILFAMLGKPGSIIMELEDSFRINPSIDFITNTEKKLIEKLVLLGFHFKRL